MPGPGQGRETGGPWCCSRSLPARGAVQAPGTCPHLTPAQAGRAARWPQHPSQAVCRLGDVSTGLTTSRGAPEVAAPRRQPVCPLAGRWSTPWGGAGRLEVLPRSQQPGWSTAGPGQTRGRPAEVCSRSRCPGLGGRAQCAPGQLGPPVQPAALQALGWGLGSTSPVLGQVLEQHAHPEQENAQARGERGQAPPPSPHLAACLGSGEPSCLGTGPVEPRARPCSASQREDRCVLPLGLSRWHRGTSPKAWSLKGPCPACHCFFNYMRNAQIHSHLESSENLVL